MSESKLREKIKMAFPVGSHLSWVESHSTSQGVPDLNFSYKGCHEWIELKFVGENERDIKVRPSQYSWFRSRMKSGGEPVMVVEVEGHGYYVIPGNLVYGPTPIKTREDIFKRSIFNSYDEKKVIDFIIILHESNLARNKPRRAEN